MEDSARGEFYPTKVIILSELPTREKEKYYQLLSYSNSKFRKDSEGRYIANVRLLAPNVKKIENGGRKKDLSNYSLVFQERLRKLKEEGFINVRIVGTDQFDYNSFPRFTALIAFNGDTVRPKVKPLSWVMKIVEDIYDHRFSHEKNDVEREEDSPSYDLMLLIFPVFVVRRLGTNVGLKALVDQTCWDLVYNCHLYRRDYLELEVFGRFLQEFYDHDDLLFYLYVRSVIAKVLHINFKTRWTKSDGPGRQPKSLWMSYRECSHVARIVFGTDNEDLYRNFLALITPQMVGQLTSATDSRRMDITEYLHLSVVGYHQSQLQSQQGGGGVVNGERLLVPLPGQTAPPLTVPNPEEQSHYFDHDNYPHDHQHQAQHHGHVDGTAAAAAAAADLHAAGRRSYSINQQSYAHPLHHSQDDEQASYELEEDEEYVNYTQHHQRGGESHTQQQQQQQHNDYTDQSPQYYEGEGYGQPTEEDMNHNEYGELSAHQSHNELDEQARMLELLALDRLESSEQQRHQQQQEEETTYFQDNNNDYNADAGHDAPPNHSDLQQFQQNEVESHQFNPQEQGHEDGPYNAQHEEHDDSLYMPPPPPEDPEGDNDDYQQHQQQFEEPNEFETLQLQREREFMAYLCDGLDEQVPAEYAEHIEADLSERLRQTVNIFLSDKHITDVDSLDALLVEFLGLEQLRVDLEATRDELVEALMGQHIQYEEGHGVDDSYQQYSEYSQSELDGQVTEGVTAGEGEAETKRVAGEGQ